MSSDNMGRGYADLRRDRKIAEHVDAIRVLLGDTVLALVCQYESGEVFVVTPQHFSTDIIHVLANIPWDDLESYAVDDGPLP